MKIFVYLIKSLKDYNYYCGITENLIKRLGEHNSGKVKITAKRRPFKLVYYKEHVGYQEARRHEKWLKKKNRSYKDKLVAIAQLAPPLLGGVK